MKIPTTSSLFLSLGFVAATVTGVVGARPAPGRYYIVNRVLSPAGDKLAITFNGQGNAASVTPLANAYNQTWTVANYNANTQSISPVSAPNLQAAFGPTAITVLTNGGYVWRVNSVDTGYSIQDGGASVFWGVNTATVGDLVTYGKGSGSEKQRWIFTPA